MKKAFLFIIDPIHTLDFKNDASFLIMAEAKNRGHEVWFTTIEELNVKNSKPHTHAAEIYAISSEKKTWEIGKQMDAPLEKFPIILMRKDPPFSIDYVMATYILSLVNDKKSFILNHPAALRNFNEKVGILQFPKFIPDTIVTKRYEDVKKFLAKHKTIVLKPLERSSGQEVIILHTSDKNRNSLLEILTHKETRYIMAQKYLKEVSKGDKRICVLNGRIIGAYNRIAHESDHRSNLHSGGTAKKVILTPVEASVCSRIAKSLVKQGIYFAGIDMIGGKITEINVTSPGGGFDIMNKGESVKMESKIVNYLETK